jgi:hypothetical protein
VRVTPKLWNSTLISLKVWQYAEDFESLDEEKVLQSSHIAASWCHVLLLPSIAIASSQTKGITVARFRYRPGVHWLQLVAPCWLYLPLGQFWHKLELSAATILLLVPAWHNKHVIAVVAAIV